MSRWRYIVLGLMLLAIVIMFSGCSTLQEAAKGNFENRLARTLPCDKAYVVSEYFDGLIGFAWKLAPRDARALCSPVPN